MPDRVGLGEYLAGCALLVAVLAAAAWAAVALVRRRLPWLTGAPRLLAGAVAMTCALIAMHLVPLILGVLSRWTALLAAALLALAVARVPRTRAAPPAAEPARGGEGRPSWALVALAAAAAGGWLAVATKVHATQAIAHVDQLTVYLPDAARLIQRGSLWENDQFVPLLANGNYPQNGVVLQVAAILPWRQDAFVRFALYPFAVLTVVALYALARELGAPRPTAWLAGIAFAATPHMAFLVVQGLADTLVFLGLATGLLFLLRYDRTRATAELVVAGAALGLAFGTKWYGAPAAAIVVALWLLQRLWRERAWRRPLGDAAIATGAVLAAGGIWLVRNAAVTPSPIFPSAVRPFGIAIFDAPRNELTERFGFTVADYVLERHMWVDHLLPAWWDAWGPFVPLALAGAAAAAGAGRRRPAVVLLALTTGALLVAYALTPNGAWGPEGAPHLVGPNARYGLPAIVAAAALTAWVAGRAGRWRPAVEAALAATVVVGLAKAPLDLDAGQVAVAAALLLAAGLAVTRGRRLAAGWPPGRAAAALGGAALVLLAGGRLLQDRHEQRRYATHDAPSAWIREHAPRDRAVGVAGRDADPFTSPIYPAFGPRLRNRVEYVGPLVDGLLRTYEDARSFTAALRRGRFDLLIVYRPSDPAQVAREQRWATAAGFTALAQDQRLTLLGRR
jgi:hypothetical protein